jgi:hypothetical protein
MNRHDRLEPTTSAQTQSGRKTASQTASQCNYPAPSPTSITRYRQALIAQNQHNAQCSILLHFRQARFLGVPDDDRPERSPGRSPPSNRRQSAESTRKRRMY